MVRPFREGESCVECGTSERNFHARGLCVNCYARLLRRENPETYRAIDEKHRNSKKRKRWVKEYTSTEDYKEYILQKAREYRERNKEVCYERTRKWRKENPDKLKAYEEARRDVKTVKKYGEDALRKMMECDYKCQKCGSNKRVAIHHIDWDDKNNIYENFAILCNSCHSKVHQFIPERFRLGSFKEFMKSQ